MRRRKKWRSCSNVTPIPPWIWTQSWPSSVPYSPMKADAAMAESRRDRIAGRRRHCRRVGDRVGCLEPGLHVGEAMLERLVRRQRTTERVAIEGPLDGHVERRLHRADRLGGGDRATDEQAPLDVVAGPAGRTDDRADREADVGELDAAVAPRQLGRAQGSHGHARRRRGNQHVRQTVAGPAGDEQEVGIGCRLDRTLGAVEHHLVAVDAYLQRPVIRQCYRVDRSAQAR